MIYISEVFLKIETRLSQITCLLFIDDLSILTFSYSVREIKKALEEIESIALGWKTNNAVTYDINKTKAILFSKARNPKLIK